MLFWPSVVHSAALLQQFSFPFVVVDPVFVSLLVLVVTLNGRSRDFLDPRLLNLHPRPAKMNMEVFAHEIWIFREPSCSSGDIERSLTRFCGSTIAESSSTSCEDKCEGMSSRDLDLSSLPDRRLCSAFVGGPVAGDEGFTSQVLE